MYLKKQLGNLGEEIATNYLQENNYEIIERNFNCRQGEIDIIAKDKIKQELVFLEVKTRTNHKYGTPAESVDKRKQKHIYKSASYYIYKNSITSIPIRFDVIEINKKINKYEINHIRKAFG